eukprot:CAMPEP_0172358830 /NCGR_PEP_ID=MMETSP1060-20121228/3103_1 /TAXON_ID=37318 /ORGANISM="Pseudo-nitzschia pungens, Strain cf. cingulata" /LENGTH=45 /DNA_ID= /DNA_START= /DNA_END= /DNA_ORIENTATION=
MTRFLVCVAAAAAAADDAAAAAGVSRCDAVFEYSVTNNNNTGLAL